jgi:Fe2+ transport system protein FeoA
VGLEPSLMQRLLEMGLIPGETIEVVRIAPLGDPLEVKIQGYFLSLRKSEAAGVELA